MTTINITLDPGGIQPCRATPGSGAFDMHALIGGILPSGGRALVDTGVHIELPEGYAAEIQPRSGLAARSGISILNSPGLIDSDYRGSIKVILHNTDRDRFRWQSGDRVAQMKIIQLPEVSLKVSDSLDSTDRGDGGLGSTGVAA